jgi:histone demethylase JARID1
MKMLPPYTQTLFIELMRFTPGQPDGLYSNGHSHRHTGTPTMGRQAMTAGPSPHSRHVPHTPIQSSPPLNGFGSDRPMNIVTQHVPPPPPWSRWSTMTVPPAVPLPQGHIPTPPSSRKRKFVDATPAGVAAESSASAKRSKPQTPKPQTPKPQTPKPPIPLSDPSPRSSHIVSSPSLAKVLAPSDSQPPVRPSTSAVMPSIQLSTPAKSSPSRTSTPVRSVKLVVSKKQDS